MNSEYRTHDSTSAIDDDLPPAPSALLDRAARALYEHWVTMEDFGNEYCEWDRLPDKQTWRDRARNTRRPSSPYARGTDRV